MRFLLDTSVWYRGIVEPQAFPASIQAIVSDPDASFGLSAISLWEIAKKVQIGRLSLDRPLPEWLDHALSENIVLLPLTNAVVSTAVALANFPNRDPADEIIVATATVNNLTLITTDRALRNYPHAQILYFKPLSET